MNSFSEQGSIDPDNPKLDYAPLGLSERAAKLGPLMSQGASEPVRPSPILRPVLVPKEIDEPARRTRRTALLSVAAAVAVVAVATLLFGTMKPASRQLVASPTPSETTGSIPQLDQGDVESQPTLAELKVTLPPSQPPTHEESQQLLQRFLQWREKANMTEASQP
jgi:hypothetical protein